VREDTRIYQKRGRDGRAMEGFARIPIVRTSTVLRHTRVGWLKVWALQRQGYRCGGSHNSGGIVRNPKGDTGTGRARRAFAKPTQTEGATPSMPRGSERLGRRA